MKTLHIVGALTCFIFFFSSVRAAQLSPSFYDQSCPQATSIVNRIVSNAVLLDNRMAASLMRLHFHDCFVNGCDASVLLDDNVNFVGEKTANANFNSLRGFEVIDNIKTELEKSCPGVVSCADTIAMAAHQGVIQAGGPTWSLPLGNKDSRTTGIDAANSQLPSSRLQFSGLVSVFAAKGFSIQDLVALSGAHTIGFARCSIFSYRLYNFSADSQTDPKLSPIYANLLRLGCPPGNADNIAPLDSTISFDNSYFNNILGNRGLLNSDQVLSDSPLVNKYALDSSAFFSDFSSAMVKLGSLSPANTALEIRSRCRVPN